MSSIREREIAGFIEFYRVYDNRTGKGDILEIKDRILCIFYLSSNGELFLATAGSKECNSSKGEGLKEIFVFYSFAGARSVSGACL